MSQLVSDDPTCLVISKSSNVFTGENSKQEINLASFLMHESFCLRNIVLCDKCSQPFDKSQRQEHFEEYHALVACECGEQVEKSEIESHKVRLGDYTGMVFLNAMVTV